MPYKPKVGPPAATQDGGGHCKCSGLELSSSWRWRHYARVAFQASCLAAAGKNSLQVACLDARSRDRSTVLRGGDPSCTLPVCRLDVSERLLLSTLLGCSRRATLYALRALAALSTWFEDKDCALFPALLAGVPTGFGSDIPPNGCLLPAPPSEHAFALGLAICQGNWQGAESEPASLQDLIQSEEDSGFVREFPSLEAAQAHFGPDRVAVRCGRVHRREFIKASRPKLFVEVLVGISVQVPNTTQVLRALVLWDA